MKSKNQQLLKKIFEKNLINRGYYRISDFIKFKNGHYEYKPGTKLDGDYCMVVINKFDALEYFDLLFSLYAVTNTDVLKKWYNTFTKSVFLIGNPNKLTYKYKDSISVYSNDMCISKISNSKVLFGISQMLKKLTTQDVYVPDNIIWSIPNELNKESKMHRLYIRNGLKLERYLVHLTHTIMENLINGNIRSVDVVKIINKKNVRIHKKSIYSRIGISETNNKFLTLYSDLT